MLEREEIMGDVDVSRGVHKGFRIDSYDLINMINFG